MFFFINSSNGLIEGRATGGAGIILYSDDFSEEDESLLSLSLSDSDSDSSSSSEPDDDVKILQSEKFMLKNRSPYQTELTNKNLMASTSNNKDSGKLSGFSKGSNIN